MNPLNCSKYYGFSNSTIDYLANLFSNYKEIYCWFLYDSTNETLLIGSRYIHAENCAKVLLLCKGVQKKYELPIAENLPFLLALAVACVLTLLLSCLKG